jgi:hypothetical protein
MAAYVRQAGGPEWLAQTARGAYTAIGWLVGDPTTPGAYGGGEWSPEFYINVVLFCLEPAEGLLEKEGLLAAERAAARRALSRAENFALNKAVGRAAEEEFIRSLEGEVARQVRFKTPLFGHRSYRVLDAVSNSIGYEVKSGYRGLTSAIKKQIAKDVTIISNPENGLHSINWVFMPGRSGYGLTAELEYYLRRHGIGVVLG